ncbi:MAG: ABC transporter ATP-binding protein [Saprospiraceae bacterium]
MEHIISTNNLTKKFGDFTAVNNITFQVDKGEIFGFLGANGAGKTTAMKMLCGLLVPTSGSGKVAGFDIAKESNMIKKNIGYMSQKFSLYEDLTVEENMQFFGGIYGLSSKQIKQKIGEYTHLLDGKHMLGTLVGALPLGWKQRIAFITANLHDPYIVFLDEPTGGVDPIVRRQFWELIYNASARGTTIFVTTHYMDEAEYCHRVSIMVDGVIAALDSPHNLKKQFGVQSMDDVFYQLARQAQRSETV